MEGLNLVSRVSCKKAYENKTDFPEFRVTVIDYGVKLNTIRCLNNIKADVTVVPHNFSKKEILNYPANLTIFRLHNPNYYKLSVS